MVDAIVEAGHFVSVTPDVLVREQDRDLVRRVPLTSLVLETDAPWEQRKGRPAEPAWVRQVAEEVARIKGCSLAEVSRVTTKNALALIKGLGSGSAAPEEENLFEGVCALLLPAASLPHQRHRCRGRPAGSRHGDLALGQGDQTLHHLAAHGTVCRAVVSGPS